MEASVNSGAMRLSLVALAACLVMSALRAPVPVAAQAGSSGMAGADWPLHNGSLDNSGYSPLSQITNANAGTLALKWSFQLPEGDNASSQTPIVKDGVLYFNAGSKLFALDGATGKQRWLTRMTPEFQGGGRGPGYGEGRVYAFGPTSYYAVDAKTGSPVESFGKKGLLQIVNQALEFKDPGKHPATLDPTTLGYLMTTPPVYHDGTLYAGIPFSDSLIEGGLLVAADGRTGAIKWVFRTVPQHAGDDGWEIAKDTWSGPKRLGGGIWTPPAIDPELGLIYVNIGNPSPNYDASSRLGMNLFTNSMVALNLRTGKLVWHFQALHHDIWDWDLVTGPTLMDLTVDGKPVKAVATAPKNCYVYVFNRETGAPINPIVETPVPTTTDIPGEQPWPTQPIPYTSRNVPQQPFCATYPRVSNPELAKRVRPTYHPYLSREFVITSPGNTGGPNMGRASFSPKTGLYYISGKNAAWSVKPKPIGNTLPDAGAPANLGHFGLIAEVGDTGMTSTQNIAALDPATGRLAWVVEVPGVTGTGTLVTGGDVVVQAVGRDVYVLDAKSGEQRFKTSLKDGSRSTPMTYSAGGRQFVAMVSGTRVVAFGLP